MTVNDADHQETPRLTVAHHAIGRSEAQPGGTVVIYGAGPIALFVLSPLQAKGIDRVICVEMSSIHKERARQAGAMLVLDPTEVNVPERVRQESHGLGAHVSFECVGVNADIVGAMESWRFQGTCVNVAIWGQKPEVDMHRIVNKEIRLLGTFAYARDHDPVVELLKSGKLDVADFVTGNIAAEDVYEEGIRQLVENKDEKVKILVHP